MTLLTWNPACTVGVRAMDDQHGILMDTMNEVRVALVCGRAREQLIELLERLIEFTRMHFWSEEQLMEQMGFPGLADHRAQHQDMMQQIVESAHRVEHESGVAIHPLLCRMRDGYSEHIEGFDREYGAWMNERGVQ